MNQKIGIIGAGSFGTALSILLGGKGYDVRIWAYEKEVVESINRDRQNSLFLQGFEIPEKVEAVACIEDAVSFARDLLISALPMFAVRKTLLKINSRIPQNSIVLSVTKGIEPDTLFTVSEVLEQILPEELHDRLAFLSGPSFAKEVARKMPTLVNIASKNEQAASRAQELISSSFFRAYTTDDVAGVELGGALKNVIAIAAGIVAGLNMGFNTTAAVITRGLWEIARLSIKKGAQPLTLAGLAGTGDLVLTCTGELSRNRTVGIRLAKGEKISDIISSMKMVAEGVPTTKAAYNLAGKLEVDTPITEQVYKILYEDKDCHSAVYELMTRDLKKEIDEKRGI
jgi:glycerol-3-phosphate dehydrogenase (NAD(P)+)